MSGYIEGAAECPSCHSRVEPEQDGDVVFFPCSCGYHFGYTVIRSEPACQLGIPETIRRAASVPQSGTVDVQISRRPQ